MVNTIRTICTSKTIKTHQIFTYHVKFTCVKTDEFNHVSLSVGMPCNVQASNHGYGRYIFADLAVS